MLYVYVVVVSFGVATLVRSWKLLAKTPFHAWPNVFFIISCKIVLLSSGMWHEIFPHFQMLYAHLKFIFIISVFFGHVKFKIFFIGDNDRTLICSHEHTNSMQNL